LAAVTTPASGDPITSTWGASVASALNPYGCVLLRTATQSIGDASDTAVTFPTGSVTEVLDTNSFHDGGTNTARITIPTGGDGWYDIGAIVEFDANATGHRQVWLAVDGTEIAGSRITNAAYATVNNRLGIPTMPYDLDAAQYVTLNVRQNSGGSLNLIASGVRFWVVRRWPA
jgi:hypothetical protein